MSRVRGQHVRGYDLEISTVDQVIRLHILCVTTCSFPEGLSHHSGASHDCGDYSSHGVPGCSYSGH